MNSYFDLYKIHWITDNIYLSGIFPMDEDPNIIKRMNIKYILSCVPRQHAMDVHNKIIIDNPDIIILYLPYNDNIGQNLWQKNLNKIEMIKYGSKQNYNLKNQFMLYHNKPMIEIGYHFINNSDPLTGNVLVHCMAGVSRSVSVVIYYLMKKYFENFDKTFAFVKSKRPIANPNDSFKGQLQKYETKRDRYTEADANQYIYQ